MHDEARGKKRSVDNDDDDDGGNDRSKARRTSQYSHSQYTVGWVCALPKEQTAAIAMLDEQHESLLNPHSDPNAYTLGSIGDHNIVIACLPKGQIGTASAATVATRMVQTFPCVKFGLMVGIGGGVPRRGIDVRLGDVVVGTPTGSFGGVVQWDMGKAREGGRFERTGALNAPPPSLLSALTKIETRHAMHEPRIPRLLEDMFARWPKLAPMYSRSEELVDVLFRADYGHVEKSELEPDEEEDDNAACRFCDRTRIKLRKPASREMMIHYGLIASGNQVIKDARFRDQLNTELGGEVLCIEMEAAGLLTNFPCLIVRGICDYADSHKNKAWQEHAAAVAAAFAKELLLDHVQPEEVNRAPTALEHLAEQVQEVFDSVTQFHSEMLLNQDVDAVKWLSVTDYASIQRDHFEKAHQGTCQWFLNSPEYWLWQHSSGKTLYCPGIPGAGKTILASIVINDVVSKFQHDDGVGIAYVYFSYERRGEQNLDHVLSCLLKQLAQTALNQSRLPESVRELVNKHWRWGTRPSSIELFQTLQSICAVFSSVFILIDALDECQAHVLSSLVSKLPELQTKVGKPANVLVTSRSIPDIAERFEGCPTIEIKASEEDISLYMVDCVPDFRVRVARIPGLEAMITNGISQAVGGMFLLARLYLDSLMQTTSVREILSALEKFKQRHADMAGSQHESDEVYDMIYDEAMDRIDGQAPNLRHLGMEVLAWIVHAVRPLTATELNHALAVNLDDESFDRDNIRDVEILASVCAGLVTIDDASQTIRLVHYTTQEYFLRRKDRFFPGAHDRMTSVCIKYLRFAHDELSNTDQEVKSDKPGRYPFYQHSIYAWAYHAGRSAHLNDDVLSFLLDASIMETLITLYPTGRRLPVTGAGWAAYGGMKEAIYFFHTHEHDLDAPDIFGRTPLFYAAKAGHYDVAKLLCDLGATVTPWHRQAFFPSNTTRWSSPEATTEAGNEHSSSSELSTTILRKDSGGSLATRRTHSTIEFEVATSSLWVVSDFRSNLDIARLLLEKGASVDAKNSSGQTSLVVACKEGNTALLDLLLDKGASVDAEDYYGSTPLLVAVVNGHSSCAYKLLQRGARFRTAEQGHKALTLATRLGDALLVKALLDVGAPIALDASRTRNLLIIAAERDDAEVAKLLVSRGADTEVPDASGRTALACAAQMGHFETARALIEGGADVQTTDCNGQAPLSLACAFSGGGPGKHLTTIRLLVEQGARVNAKCHAGCTALFWATRDGGPLRAGEPDDVVRFLIGAGADIEFLRRRAQEVRRTTLLRA